jgi:sucrose-phosphate synthase
MRITLFSDIDGTLVGSEKSLAPVIDLVERREIDICYVTSRSLRSALEVVTETGLPRPRLLASSVGTCLSDFAEPDGTLGRRYEEKIRINWTRHVVWSEALRIGWQPQPATEQTALKASFWLDDTNAEALHRYLRTLHRQGVEARALVSSDKYIDVLPQRAGKAAVVAFAIQALGLDASSCVVAGDTEADIDMLTMGMRAVVPANARAPVVSLGSSNRCFVSSDSLAAGVAEGLEYWAAELGG